MVSVSSEKASPRSIEKILLFLSNGITPEDSLDEFRRVPLFNLLLFIGMATFTPFALHGALSGHYVYALLEMIVSIILLTTYIVTRQRGIPAWASLGMLSFFYLFFIGMGITGGPDGNGYLWVFSFPLAATFLSGPRRGIIWSITLLIAIFSISNIFGDSRYIISYPAPLILRTCACYSILLLFAGFTDSLLLYTYHQMHLTRSKLEETIEELNKSRDELQQQAIHDGLTGVFNRRFFNQTITTWTIQAQRHESSTALFMIDVDKFKRYNDRFGHLKGDMVLKSVANALQKSLRRESDMVFRYGGEEFAILLTKTSEDVTRKIADSIMENIRKCNIPHPDAPTGLISVSIGVAAWNPKSEEIFSEEFIEIADEALYEAKAAGRNCVVYKEMRIPEFIREKDLIEINYEGSNAKKFSS